MCLGGFVFGGDALHAGFGMLHGSLAGLCLPRSFGGGGGQAVDGIGHLLDDIDDCVDIQSDFLIFRYNPVEDFGGIGFFIDSSVDFHGDIEQVFGLILSELLH